MKEACRGQVRSRGALWPEAGSWAHSEEGGTHLPAPTGAEKLLPDMRVYFQVPGNRSQSFCINWKGRQSL